MKNYHQISYVQKEDPWLKKVVIRLVEQLSGQPKVQTLYEQLQDTPIDSADLWSKALDKLSIRRIYESNIREELGVVNRPLIIIANHPFGIIDGLILGEIASKVNPKFCFLVNAVLCGRDERLKEFLLPISFDNTKEAQSLNIQSRKEAIRRISHGETLAIFPSGGVATSNTLFSEAIDLEWKRFVVKVILKSNAAVLPVFIHGTNSRLFQLASALNSSLRLGLLIHEVNNKIGKSIRISFREIIEHSELSPIKSKQGMLDFLRSRTLEGKQKNPFRKP